MKKVLLSIFVFILIILCVSSLTVDTYAASNENIIIDGEEKATLVKPNNYLEPAYSKVEYSDLPNDAPTRGSSTKDEYENNNSFEDASLLFENGEGEPCDLCEGIRATLHRDPWYYLFWRDIDEDYFRFDVLADATITIELTNIPSGCNYNIELYKHDNVKNSSFQSISIVDGSRNDEEMDEEITQDIEPGSYYIRVYSSEGYSADDNYILSYNLVYKKTSPTSISNLRYNKGANAAVWTSDFNPFGIAQFNLEGKEEVGYKENIPLASQNFYANPIHETMNTRAGSNYITQSVVYIWNLEWRNIIRAKLIEMANELEAKVGNANQEVTIEFDDIIGAIGFGFAALGVAVIFKKSALIANIATLGGFAASTAELLIPMMFPKKWETDSQTALNYMQRLIAALEVSSGTSDNEVVKIEYRYKYEREDDNQYVPADPESGLSYTISIATYYLNFAYSPNTSYNFLYDSNYIPAYNDGAYTFGKTYGLRNFDDISAFYNGEPVTNLQDVNTDTPTEVFLDSSYSDHINTGEYHWYKFTAPVLGHYSFSTFGSADTYGELFTSPVPGQSKTGRVSFDNNSGTGNNFLIDYEMAAGSTVYIRVRGYNWTSTGPYSFMVTGQEIPVTEVSLDTTYSESLEANQASWYEFTAQSNGEYIFETTGNMNTYGELFEEIVAGKTYDGLLIEDNNSGDGYNFRIIYSINEGEIVYIRLRGNNWSSTGSFSFSVRKVKELNLVLDPVNMVSYGTEVTMNGGIKGGTTMTIGYTRNAYLQSNAPSTSRLQYNWTVSNSNIAKVSAYGTVTALNPGTVEIIATYKIDTSYIAKVTITVYPEASTNIHILEFTTDNRESPNSSGSEVTMNGGTPGEFTIHKGFTRFINFNGGAPNPILQDYIWSSNNSAILSVDMYGIVTAYSRNITYPMLVTITCIYKYNPLYQGTVTFIVYP